MGQQQLLLLVIAFAVVGIAIVAGFNMFHNAADAAQVDSVSQECTGMAVKAQAYYLTPAYRGGGGNTFSRLTLQRIAPASPVFPAGETEDGTYEIEVQPQTVTITGTPKRSSAASRVVTAVVTPSLITLTVAD
ncbi:MAG TPA: hypothetical protein PLG50_02165 [bacterium]|nr:hypothetical protein [bacterium]HQG44448.1 hypothetical protein [bacterium]HQI47537.1 hypothetical protein [bacterium]HQJ63113.1 hypothetical protein [bacterium]